MVLGGSRTGPTRLHIATAARVLSSNAGRTRIVLVGGGGTSRGEGAGNLSLSAQFITHRLLACAAGISQQSSPICPDIALAADIPGVTHGCVANATCADSSVTITTRQSARKKQFEFLITLLTKMRPSP